MKTTYKLTLRAALLTAAAVVPAVAQAQTGIDDIVVTAQRRAESLQDVPLAVSAIQSKALQAQGATDIQTLSTVTPGLTMSNQRGALQPYLRGVGTQSTAPGDEGSIAIYIDGVYQPAAVSNVQSLSNISRIEVLRGPQGTLFGRNATGGLIHIITTDPTQKPQLDVTAGYANYDTVTGSLYGNTGLTDTLSANLAISYSHQGHGWGRNLTTGEDVNKRKDFVARAKLGWKPTDQLDVLLMGMYSHVRGDHGLVRTAASDAILPGNKLIDGIGLAPGQSVYDTRANVPANLSTADAHQYATSLKIAYDLGWGQLQSLTAYSIFNNFEIVDQDGTGLGAGVNLAALPGRSPADAANSPVDITLGERTRALQQEFLFQNKVGHLETTAGIFLYHAKAALDPIRLRTNALSGGPTLIDRSTYNQQITRSYAGFFQGTFHLTDSTGLTAGLRYTRDQRKISGTSTFIIGGAPQPPTGTVISSLPATKRDPVTGVVTPFTADDANREFNKLTYRFAIDHHFNDQFMTYASYSRGFKSGVFNTTAFAPAVFPEVLDAIAIGFKSDLLDRTIRLNVEAFHYNYRNLQVSQIIAGTTSLLNAAKAKIKGVDVEAAWAPPVATGALKFSTNFSITDAKYASFPGAPAFYAAGTPKPANFTGCAGTTRTVGGVACSVDASGNDVIYAPKVSGTGAVDYSYQTAAGGTIAFNATLYFNGGYATSYDGTLRQPSYHVLSASLGYTSPDKAWDVRVWGSNLTKEVYFLQWSQAAYGLQVSPGAPRTYGLSLGYHFGG